MSKIVPKQIISFLQGNLIFYTRMYKKIEKIFFVFSLTFVQKKIYILCSVENNHISLYHHHGTYTYYFTLAHQTNYNHSKI